jgi:hypothetical protein
MDIKELRVAEKGVEKRNHPWEYARCRVIFDILKPFITNLSNRLHVLDIGCGDLFFLNQFCKEFAKYHPITVAIDTAFDDQVISSLKKKYQDLPVHVYKDLQAVKLNQGQAKIVFLLDVVEHIENNHGFLELLLQQTYIDKDTLFIITAPAFNNLFSKHDQWLGHYRRYSQKELQRTVEDVGFRHVQGGYFFFTLLLVRFVQKYLDILLRKKDKEVKGIGDWHHGKILSLLYENFLLGDYYAAKLFRSMGIKVPGLSTYIVCILH